MNLKSKQSQENIRSLFVYLFIWKITVLLKTNKAFYWCIATFGVLLVDC